MQLRAAAWYWIGNPDVTMTKGPSLASTLERYCPEGDAGWAACLRGAVTATVGPAFPIHVCLWTALSEVRAPCPFQLAVGIMHWTAYRLPTERPGDGR